MALTRALDPICNYRISKKHGTMLKFDIPSLTVQLDHPMDITPKLAMSISEKEDSVCLSQL